MVVEDCRAIIDVEDFQVLGDMIYIITWLFSL